MQCELHARGVVQNSCGTRALLKVDFRPKAWAQLTGYEHDRPDGGAMKIDIAAPLSTSDLPTTY